MSASLTLAKPLYLFTFFPLSSSLPHSPYLSPCSAPLFYITPSFLPPSHPLFSFPLPLFISSIFIPFPLTLQPHGLWTSAENLFFSALESFLCHYLGVSYIQCNFIPSAGYQVLATNHNRLMLYDYLAKICITKLLTPERASFA